MKTISKFKILTLALVSQLVYFTGCAPAHDVEFKRDANFFNGFVNGSAGYATASSQVENLKLLATGEEYPMRVALFDNNKFYYQIDKLGDGEGTWEFKDGALYLTASRKIFDMNLVVTAANANGNETLINFFDRYGYNSISIQYREPASSLNAEANTQIQSLPPLRSFSYSNKGI